MEKGAKKSKTHNFDALLSAVEEIKIDKKSIRSVAAAYNIPKSNLARYIGKIDAIGLDISKLDDDEILHNLLNVTHHGAATVSTISEIIFHLCEIYVFC